MDVNIEIKIKVNGKDIVLKNEDAKELYFKLKEIYDKEIISLPYPIYVERPCRQWEPYYSTTGNFQITNNIRS